MSRFISAALCALFVFAMSATDAKAAYNAAAGKPIYDTNCATCHKDGLMNAPKIGDKPAWAPRIKGGLDLMTIHSIKGFQGKKGMMPPRGGNIKLKDADVANAVAYMVQLSK